MSLGVPPPKVDSDMIHVLLLNNRNEIGEALCRVGSRFGACPKLERFELVPSPLGCGYFGCVFPTQDPDVVMKITTDPSEASFAATRIGIVSPSGGIAHYYEGYRIPGLHYLRGEPDYDSDFGVKERVFVLWRESADPAGLGGNSNMFRARSKMWSQTLGAKRFSEDDVFDAFDEFEKICFSYFTSAKTLVRSRYAAAAPGSEAVWKAEMRSIAASVGERGPDFFVEAKKEKGFWSAEGLIIEAFAEVLKATINFSASPVGKELGDFLGEQLIEKHFFLADVRLANMGMVPSSRGPALIDPGLAMYFGAKKLPKLPDLPLQ